MNHKLYIARKEARLSQRQLAADLNISNATYSLKETGKAQFTIAEAKKLARILGCTLNDLFWEDEKTESESVGLFGAKMGQKFIVKRVKE